MHVCPWCLYTCTGKVGAAGMMTKNTLHTFSALTLLGFTTWIEQQDFKESFCHKVSFNVGVCDIMAWDVRLGRWCTVYLVWAFKSREEAARLDSNPWLTHKWDCPKEHHSMGNNNSNLICPGFVYFTSFRQAHFYSSLFCQTNSQSDITFSRNRREANQHV